MIDIYKNKPPKNNYVPLKRYQNVVFIKKYNIDIIEKINITPDKEICLIKTCWLKIFQRVCKKKIQKRLLIYQKRKHPKSIMFRQIHGKWKE